MKKLYDSRAFWMIVSLLASLAIWVYVTSMQSTEFSQTFYGVEVELVGESTLRETKNMVITDLDTSTVTVRIRDRAVSSRGSTRRISRRAWM